MAYLLPGDFCDLHVFVLKQMDHSIATISKCLVVDIPRDRILRLLERPKAFAGPVVRGAGGRGGVARMAGQYRPTTRGQRLAHVLCELLLRLRIVGLADKSYELPLSQKDLRTPSGHRPCI